MLKLLALLIATAPKLLGSSLLSLIYLFFLPSLTYATNLLQNGDFTSGNIDPWVSYNGPTGIVVSDISRNAPYSLKITTDKTSSYGLQQTTTNIVGDKTYKVSGYGLTNDSNIKNFFIRVAWYASTDASGSQLSTEDTNSITTADNQWHELTNTFQAPSNAKSAKTRLVLSSSTTANQTYVYFDDILFEESTTDILSSPSPTPTPTPTTTSNPTPSSTPTPTATPTPSPSSSFTISNIPSEITTDQSFTAKVELTISGNPDTVYYLKGAFKKTGGTRYFGLTKKDGNWIEYGDDYSEQYQITTDHNSSWSGNLEIKPDIYDKDYKGSGDYIFKVGRLTVSDSGSSWSNEAAIKLNNGADETTIPTSGTSSAAPPIETSLDSSSAVLAAESEYVVSSDSSDIAPTSSEEATPIQVAGEKTNKPNFIVIIGATLVFSGIGSITYLYFKNKVKF